ncbi:RsmE family RNA methyltransferase [Lapidilactobacillus achengensis]|uniref:Ribosomal RNA small subunit methyltransferase E n=1 Tax=Lapidilactobacillus achengensis TaxID=2486000 RepID=A0ABW1UP06_9LACO|nr:RsmE family RNA methyltransferase [Lapidilactobacillus achengensis]
MQLLFVERPLMPAAQLVLTGAAYQHVICVLRLEIGAALELVGSDQVGFAATITAIDPANSSFSVQLAAVALPNTELPVQATIICGLPKGEKTKLIVQKATELGVARIIFCPMQRSIMRWRPEQVTKKVAHLQQIAASAAEQSHRRLIPQVEYWPTLAPLPSVGLNLVAYEEVVKNGQQDLALAQAFQTLRQQLLALPHEAAVPPTDRPAVRMIFGPEGGLAPVEVADLTARGVQSVGLGPRILRTETAPLYFLSSLSYAIEVETLPR